jgi:hypothetical protein
MVYFEKQINKEFKVILEPVKNVENCQMMEIAPES